MDPDGTLVPLSFLLAVSCSLLSAVFSVGEAAISSLGPGGLQHLSEGNPALQRKLRLFLLDGERYYTLATAFVTASTFFTATFLAYLTADSLVLERMLPALTPALLTLLRLIAAALLFVFYLTLMRFLPRAIGIHAGAKAAVALTPFMTFMCGAVAPIGHTAVFLAHLLAKLFRVPVTGSRSAVTEAGIMLLVDRGEELGVIAESQKQMIENIFEFDDITVGDIMTHRTDIVGLPLDTPVTEAIRLAVSEGYSRFPVFRDDIDEIVGTLSVKDLLQLIGVPDISERTAKDYLRETIFLPRSKRCRDVFSEMRQRKIQLAVVVDEYGGTAGIVTLEDLLEAIVGNIQDEYDDEEEEIVASGDGAFVLDGAATLYDVERALGLDLPDEEGYETMGGFIMDLLGRIPGPGETPSADYGGYTFTVLAMEDRRIAKIGAVPTTPKAEPQPEEN